MTTHSISKFAATLAAVLTVAFAAPSMRAEGPEMHAKVNVPFAFELGDKHFEPGVYNLSLQGEHILRIAGKSDSTIAMIMQDTSSKPSRESKVVFQHVGNKYFLSQVWSAGDAEHIQTIPTPSERRSQESLQASSAVPASSVAIAMLQAGH
jgi:hypothetical protein